MNARSDLRPDDSLLPARRAFLASAAGGLGRIALGALLGGCAASGSVRPPSTTPRGPHFAPRARRVLCLFQSEGVSHIDLFDDKPALHAHAGKELPPSVRGTQRVTGMTSGQDSFPVVPPLRGGKRCGRSGLWLSDLLPHLQTAADELCVIRSMHTEAINHDPAITLLNTGNQIPGYASMGAWASYGLGSENQNLPAFLAMVSQGSGKNPGQPIFSRLWGSGFLPSSHQGVGLRPGADPVPYLRDPDGVAREQRRALLDDLQALDARHAEHVQDPEIGARLLAYEMAFRMQTSVPDLVDLRGESEATLAMYGPDVRRPGSYASNCLLARRLLERGVRFVQLFHRGWDQHIALARQLPDQCRDVDQPTAAVLRDLRQRGLLDDTLVVFATEFGRTTYSQGALGDPSSGRDHHGRCFTMWLAGGGVRGGTTYGATDEFCYNVAADPVHVRDLHATILHCLGIDHERLVFPFRGLDTRLTGVEPARVVREILA
jgi:hypothetical protein